MKDLILRMRLRVGNSLAAVLIDLGLFILIGFLIYTTHTWGYVLLIIFMVTTEPKETK
jgi:hypothetical protein